MYGYTQTGIYADTLNNANGCDSVRTLNLTVNEMTDTIIFQEICADATFLGYNTTGTFIDIFTNANGCDSARTINLIVHPLYFTDTTIYRCQGEEYFCDGALQTANGVYWDSTISIYGCASITKTTLVFLENKKPYLGPNQEICAGENVRLTPGGFNYYLWNDGDTNEIKYVNQSGEYIIRVANNIGCFAYDTINITVNAKPIIAIDYSQSEICMGDAILLKSTGAQHYAWYLPRLSPSIISSNDSLYHIPKTISEVVRVVGWSNENCSDTLEITLRSINCCGSIIIPNAFSPNNDNLNDAFGLIANPKIENMELAIFNRWGQRVFVTNNFNEKWDGLFNNVPCEIGVYYYLIQVKCYSEKTTKTYKGEINLLR